MPNLIDDFDTQITPEELFNEDINDDLLPDGLDLDHLGQNEWSWLNEELQWQYMNGEYPDEE